MIIDFAVRAPDEATFWQAWENAGIVGYDAEGNRVLAPEYREIAISSQTSDGWVPTRDSGRVDEDGNAIMEPVPGWHANVRVHGDLALQMTAGLPQYDDDGNLLDVFQRTHAVQVFGLTEQPADAVSGFPAGYRNSTGVHYADTAHLKSPSNVWA